MRPEVQAFLKSNDKVLVIDRERDIDVVSHWKRTRHPLQPPFNNLIMQLAKLSPSQKLTRWLFRSLLNMKVGRNTSFSPIDIDPLLPELISIGDNSVIGWKATLLCHYFTHTRQKFGKIIIGKNVVVGAMSVIGPGVEIGDNAAVALNSLVITDIPANELWGGNPAKRIRALSGPI